MEVISVSGKQSDFKKFLVYRMNNYIQPNFNLNLTVAKDLLKDYTTSTDGNYKSSLSTVLNYKVSTLTSIANFQNQNLVNQISTLIINY